MAKMLTVDQAAERLGTSPRFVRRLIAQRRIAFSKIGRHVRIDVADIDAFIRAGRVEPWSVSGTGRGSMSGAARSVRPSDRRSA